MKGVSEKKNKQTTQQQQQQQQQQQKKTKAKQDNFFLHGMESISAHLLREQLHFP